MRFKVLDFTLSGVTIDARGVAIYPHSSSSRVQMSVTRELVATEYFIWNSLG